MNYIDGPGPGPKELPPDSCFLLAGSQKTLGNRGRYVSVVGLRLQMPTRKVPGDGQMSLVPAETPRMPSACAWGLSAQGRPKISRASFKDFSTGSSPLHAEVTHGPG